MEEVYKKRLNLIEILRLCGRYLKQRGLFWSTLVGGFWLLVIIATYLVISTTTTSVLNIISKNPETMDLINSVENNGTQVFVLIKFIIKIIAEVGPLILVVYVILALLHSMVSALIFINQDLFVKNTEFNWVKSLKYLVIRVPAIIATDLLLGLYYLLFVVLITGILLMGLFLIPMTWTRLMVGIVIAIICLFSITWCYTHMAVFKYKVNGNRALRYSNNVVGQNPVNSGLWITISGSLYLLIIIGLLSLFSTNRSINYPLDGTIFVAILLLYNFVTRVFCNFLFLNSDYYSREQKSADTIYGDLITNHLAPVDSDITREIIELPRRNIRRTTGAALSHQKPEHKAKTKKKTKKPKKEK